MIGGDIGYLLSLIPPVINILNNLIKKNKLKKELRKIIEGPLENLSKSFNRVIDDYYNIIGAFFLSMVNIYSPFIEPKEKAKDMVSRLEDSYNHVVADMGELMRIVKTHLVEFKSILNTEERLVLEAFVEYFGKKEQPDWKLLLNHYEIKKFMKKRTLSKDKPLLDALSNEMKELNKRLGIEWIADKYLKKIQRNITNLTKRYNIFG